MSSNWATSDVISSGHLISCVLALAYACSNGVRRGRPEGSSARLRTRKGTTLCQTPQRPHCRPSRKQTTRLQRMKNPPQPHPGSYLAPLPVCCCHGTSPEPQHCIRCHANYRLNHPEACMVPHVFTNPENWGWTDMVYGDVSAPSICWGSDACGGDPRKEDWQQPSPCFMGWHTTNVEAVEESYNGINVLRCDLDDKGKCRRAQMKHSANYELLYDEQVSYTDADKGDRVAYLQEKRK
ncbi:hypothetical protein EV363DRAFT_1260876 [Boletus edulis]|nr:hypothetical protein EV363DRAFT_1260876 [Boletus edulis]